MWKPYRLALLGTAAGALLTWTSALTERAEESKPIELILLKKDFWYVFETSQPVFQSVRRGPLIIHSFSGTDGKVKVIHSRKIQFLPDPKGGALRYYDPFRKQKFRLTYVISDRFDPISCSSRDRLASGSMHLRYISCISTRNTR